MRLLKVFVLLGLLVAGCSKPNEDTSALPPPPALAAEQLLPAWQAVTNRAALSAAALPREGHAHARWIAPHAVELPCAFSRVRSDRACWDFTLPVDLAAAEGLAFDFWCTDVTQFTGFTIYFKSGKGWYHTPFAPQTEQSWHTVRIAKQRIKSTEGQVAGWQHISTVRICGWRGGTNDTTLAVANFRYAAPARPPTPDELRAEEATNRLFLAQQHGATNEWRAFWCHSPFGLPGKTWRETAHLLKANGFTALMPNLAWAGAAFYPSAVLPVAPQVSSRGDQLAACLKACRAEGLECHVWKICWNLGHYTTSRLKADLTKQGRTQVHFDGTPRPGWLCPSHLDNRVLEIRACLELAQKGVDGIHLDYIRYPDENFCFCAGCRKRFEASYNITLTNWPAQVRYDTAVRDLWRQFRINNITALVKAVATGVRARAPHVQISAAVFQNPTTTPIAIGQHWAHWCRQGYLDFVCPMNYHCETAVDFKGVVYSQKRALADSSVRLRPGIGLSCWPTERHNDARRVAEEILVLREADLDGFCIFNLDARACTVLPLLHTNLLP